MSYKELLKKKALQRVKEYIECLVNAGLIIRSVILFGSYSKGNFTEGSDVDLCVVAENLPQDEIQRRSLSSLLPCEGIMAIGFYPEEFMQFLKNLNGLVLDIVEYGTLIVDDGFFKDAKRMLDEFKREGIVRPESNGWRITKRYP